LLDVAAKRWCLSVMELICQPAHSAIAHVVISVHLIYHLFVAKHNTCNHQPLPTVAIATVAYCLTHVGRSYAKLQFNIITIAL